MDEDVVEEITSQLRRRGAAQSYPVHEPSIWRTAARAAARRLDRPVRTFEHGGFGYAFLRDWPANDLERQIETRALRRAIDWLRT